MRTYPDKNAIKRMYLEAGTADAVIRHMEAVAEYQDLLLGVLESVGICFDRELLHAAALLHDILRSESEHADAGAAFVREHGYPEVADIIADHHSPVAGDGSAAAVSTDTESCHLTSADILFYADKRLLGDRLVSIKERYAASAKKCSSAEARAKHKKLLRRANDIYDILHNIAGNDI